jgi:hypothetical protein
LRWTITTSIIVGAAVIVFVAVLAVQYWAHALK